MPRSRVLGSAVPGCGTEGQKAEAVRAQEAFGRRTLPPASWRWGGRLSLTWGTGVTGLRSRVGWPGHLATPRFLSHRCSLGSLLSLTPCACPWRWAAGPQGGQQGSCTARRRRQTQRTGNGSSCASQAVPEGEAGPGWVRRGAAEGRGATSRCAKALAGTRSLEGSQGSPVHGAWPPCTGRALHPPNLRGKKPNSFKESKQRPSKEQASHPFPAKVNRLQVC